MKKKYIRNWKKLRGYNYQETKLDKTCKPFVPNSSPNTYVCKYFEWCNVSKISGRNCNYPDYETCQTYKYYEKYGEGILGIGAMTESPRK
jgi:hypothetical protein